jgi:transcriptional regulator GlxA family with amidase domain
VKTVGERLIELLETRELLLQTAMPIMDITTACGFQSPPHFSKCYRIQFGYPPSAERKIGDKRGPLRDTSDVPAVAP